MSVSLSKGQRVSLVKSGGGALSQVRMGLGWDAVRKKGLFGSRAQSIDLDASALLFDAGGSLVDQVWFRQLDQPDGSVQHTGDNLTGAGDGDDESIRVYLPGVPGAGHDARLHRQLVHRQDFSQIENAFCRLIDETTETEIARYDLSGSGPHTAQIMAKLSRDATQAGP